MSQNLKVVKCSYPGGYLTQVYKPLFQAGSWWFPISVFSKRCWQVFLHTHKKICSGSELYVSQNDLERLGSFSDELLQPRKETNS